MSGFYDRYVDVIEHSLRYLSVTDRTGSGIDPGAAFESLRISISRIRDDGGFLFFCGNGASAAMASHMSADWLKNAGVRSAVFTDVASLTAYANDSGYVNVFADPIARVGSSKDALVTISSSGESPNVVKAIEAARQVGMLVVTLTAFSPANSCRRMGDINFYVPGVTYGVAESSHQVILHAWLDHFMNRLPEIDASVRQENQSPP